MATDTVGIIALMNVLATVYKGGRWRALPPVTLAYSGILLAVAAAVGAGVVNFRALVLDDALVASEPWRLLGCLLAYERTLGFAAHLYLMVLVGEQLEPRLGSPKYAGLVAGSAAIALAHGVERGSPGGARCEAKLSSLFICHALAARNAGFTSSHCLVSRKSSNVAKRVSNTQGKLAILILRIIR